MNTEGKTDCQQWYTDSWGGYQRVLDGWSESYLLAKSRLSS